MSVYKFKTVDDKCEFAVKEEFLKRCNKPADFDAYDLMTKYQMGSYLHNPSGPAAVIPSENVLEYWISGKECTPEEGAKIAHDFNFNDKLLKSFDDGDDSQSS